MHRRGSPLAWILRGLVHLYRATAVFRSPRCRFHPTCSTYALDAIRIHGGLRGAGLAVRRVGRCHPWNPGGIDHVPPPRGAAPGAHPEGALGPVHAPNRK